MPDRVIIEWLQDGKVIATGPILVVTADMKDSPPSWRIRCVPDDELPEQPKK